MLIGPHNEKGINTSLPKLLLKKQLNIFYSIVISPLVMSHLNKRLESQWALTLLQFSQILFLAFYEIKWVNDQRKLGVINIRKINNTFRFIDDLLSLNDDEHI